MWNEGPSETNPRLRKQRDQWRVRLKHQVPRHYCHGCNSLTFADDDRCVHCLDARPPKGWLSVDESGDPWLGETINDRYLIASALGSGSSGDVYRGESLSITREFAIKLIATECKRGETDRVIKRLNREIDALSRLRNPHIVSIYEILDLRGRYVAAVMDLIEGQTLETTIEEHGAMAPTRALPLLRQVANGIYGAHQAGIIHRDLKPENLMVERLPAGDDFVHILDFGIVHLIDDNSTSLTHGFIGTPLYASPEQATAKPLDHRSDIYSLGAILFYLLTGQPPFPSENVYDVLRMHVRKPAPTLSETVEGKDFPIDLEDLVARMLSKSPQDRPDDLTEVIAEIDRISQLALQDRSEASDHSQSMERPSQEDARAPSSGVLKVPKSLSNDVAPFDERPRNETPGSGQFRAPRLGGISSANASSSSNGGMRGPINTPTFQRQATPSEGTDTKGLTSSTHPFGFAVAGDEDTGATALSSAHYTLQAPISKISASHHRDNHFAILERTSGDIHLFEADSAVPRLISVEHPAMLTTLALAPQRLVLGHDDGTIAHVDLDSSSYQRLYQDVRRAPITSVDHSLGANAILAGSGSGRLYLNHPENRSTPWKRIGQSGPPIGAVAISNDGTTMAVSRDDNTLQLLNGLSPRAPMSTFRVSAPIRSMAISPDHYLLAAALVDGSLALYQLPRGQQMLSVEPEDVAVLGLNFSPLGNPIAICSIDRQVRVLEFDQIGSMA